MRLATVTVLLATFYFGFVVKCEKTTNSEDVLNKLIAGLIKHIVESSSANKVPNQKPISTHTIAPEYGEGFSESDKVTNDAIYEYESNDPLDDIAERYVTKTNKTTDEKVQDDYDYDYDDVDKAEEKKLEEMFKESKKTKNDEKQRKTTNIVPLGGQNF